MCNILLVLEISENSQKFLKYSEQPLLEKPLQTSKDDNWATKTSQERWHYITIVPWKYEHSLKEETAVFSKKNQMDYQTVFKLFISKASL